MTDLDHFERFRGLAVSPVSPSCNTVWTNAGSHRHTHTYTLRVRSHRHECESEYRIPVPVNTSLHVFHIDTSSVRSVRVTCEFHSNERFYETESNLLIWI